MTMQRKSTAVKFGAGSAMALDEFRQHEAVIEAGATHFVAVGQALAAIRDGKAYKLDGYKTFEDYCTRRWKLSRQSGYAHIAAAEVSQNVQRAGQNPRSLRQAAALAALPAAAQAEVAAEVDLDTATPAEVRDAVRKRISYAQPATLGRAVQKSDPNRKPTPLHEPRQESVEDETREREVEVKPAPIMARAQARHSVNALRSDWSRAVGAMRGLVRVYAPADVRAALNEGELAEALSTFVEWRGWLTHFEEGN